MRHIFLTLLFMVIAMPVQAADLKLQWPVACTLGENCWFMNYVDIDPNVGTAQDPHCGNRTYDGHNGIDIAVADTPNMEKGYAVLAMANGTVERLRDAEADVLKATQAQVDEARASKRDCGNGVLIRHTNGYLSQYCHLKQGSIKVKQGDAVTAGQPIAEIGLSGVTQHPHLHVTVMDAATRPIDPFASKVEGGNCLPGTATLWANATPYSSTDLVALGLTSTKPSYNDVLTGKVVDAKSGDARTLVWVSAFGLQKGDQITLTATDPAGRIVVDHTVTQENDKARQFYFGGRSQPIIAGTYKLTARVTRDGRTVDTLEATRSVQ